MSKPTGPLIAVSAVDHPTRDAWVDERAADEAAKTGVTLGDYLGREADVWPGSDGPNAWLCCHLYAVDDGSGT